MNRSRAEKNSVSEDPRTEIAAADAINIDEDNEIQSPKMSLTTRRSASLAAHGEVKRGHINAALKVRLHCGGEAPAPGPEFFTAGESSKVQEMPAAGSCNMNAGSDELGSGTEPVSGLVHEGKNMQPRITVITIGVDDLDKSLRFYRDGLGFKTCGIVGEEFEHGAVVFIDMQPGLRLALWPRSSIAHDTGLALSSPSATEMTFGHNVSSKAEVDEIMRLAEKAGAKIARPSHDTFWGGYAGYFQDPDDHVWEIVWNPLWEEQQPDTL